MRECPILVTSADRRYALPLAVMLRSAVENCRAEGGLDIRVLDGGLGWRARRAVERSLPLDKCSIRFLDARRQASKLENAPVFGHVSLATYYRFLIPTLVPEPKCLYVDADTVIIGDLGELWREPMGGALLLGVPRGTVTSATRIPGLEEYHVPPDHPRLSAGVLVMDLDGWRRRNPVPELLCYLQRYAGEIAFWDQDALNVVLSSQWAPLPEKWNVIVDVGRPDPEPTRLLARLKSEAAIVHFASAIKPWHFYANHPAQMLFREYQSRTQYDNWKPRAPIRAYRNPHIWGVLLRRIPLLGRMWMFMRKPD